MRRLSLALCLLVPFSVHAGENEAEALFRRMEKKIVEAKAIRTVFEQRFTVGGITIRPIHTTITSGAADLFRMESGLDGVKADEGRTWFLTVGDGKHLAFSRGDRIATAQVKSPPNYGPDFRVKCARAGHLRTGINLELLAPSNALERWKVSNFKMGRKEKIGDADTVVVEYDLSMPYGNFAAKVWINSDTDLPAKREFTSKDFHQVETYSEFAIDPELGAKVFVIDTKARLITLPPSPAGKSAIVWEYHYQVGGQKGEIYGRDGTAWFDVQPSGKTQEYRFVRRTARVIELFDAGNERTLLLYSDNASEWSEAAGARPGPQGRWERHDFQTNAAQAGGNPETGSGRAAKSTAAAASPDYPLHVGATWTYRSGDKVTVNRVVRHEQIGGHMCARIESSQDGKLVSLEHIVATKEGVLRVSSGGAVLERPLLFLKAGTKAGDTWTSDTKLGAEPVKTRFERDEGDVEVPGFKGKAVLVRAVVETSTVKLSVTTWFAPGKGVVKTLSKLPDGKEIVVELLKYDSGSKVTQFANAIQMDDPKVKVVIPNLKVVPEFHAKTFEVPLQGGKKYRIDMTSDDFDAFLIVHDKAGKQLAFDDDSGGKLNARLFFAAPKDDTYKIFAASLDGKTGKFDLTIAEEPDGAGKGQTFNGKLGADTRRITYDVKLVEGKTYVIDMISKELDSYLELRDAGGNTVAQDDDSGGFPNARIVFRAPKTGDYQIVARSFQNKGNGEFQVTLREE